MLTVSDDLIRSVVKDVLTHMKRPPVANGKPASGHSGVFDDVNEAVAAASAAQKKFETMGLAERRKAVDCVRRVCIDRAEEMGRDELEETKIGRLAHKIDKLIVARQSRDCLRGA